MFLTQQCFIKESAMANLDDITREIHSSVAGALGCAVVDLSSGLLLSVSHNVSYFSQTFVEAAAAAAVDIFKGKNISAVESLLGNQRGQTLENSIKEIQMTTQSTFHFMSVIPDKPNTLLVLITSKDSSLGMGWASIRVNAPKIAPLVP
jgi:hypothetical protein